MTLLFHVVLAAALFYILNVIGRHAQIFGYHQLSVLSGAEHSAAFNTLLRVAGPVVFITVAAAILFAVGFDSLVSGIFLVVPLQFLLRALFNVLWGRALLVNWTRRAVEAAMSTALAFVAYTYLILPKRPLIPDPTDIAGEIWLIVILFLYQVINQATPFAAPNERIQDRYLRFKYKRALEKYGDIIKSSADDLRVEILSYAVLIYESFNRPQLARVIERSLFRRGRIRTTGIMQVRSSTSLNDDESVRRGVAKLSRDFKECWEEATKEREAQWMYSREALQDVIERTALHKTASRYNKDDSYVSEVLILYDRLKERFYADRAMPEASPVTPHSESPTPSRRREAGIPLFESGPDTDRRAARIRVAAAGQIARLLQEVRTALLKKDFATLIGMAADEHYNAYFEHFGKEHQKYLADLIRLRNANGDYVSSSRALDNIRDIRFLELRHYGSWVSVLCRVRFRNAPAGTASLNIVHLDDKLYLTAEIG